MNKSQIITAVIAVYGAVLSTVTILRQYVSDRVKVKVSVRKNMMMVGDPRYKGMTLTILTVTNVGKRRVTITTFGAIGSLESPSVKTRIARIESCRALCCGFPMPCCRTSP